MSVLQPEFRDYVTATLYGLGNFRANQVDREVAEDLGIATDLASMVRHVNSGLVVGRLLGLHNEVSETVPDKVHESDAAAVIGGFFCGDCCLRVHNGQSCRHAYVNKSGTVTLFE